MKRLFTALICAMMVLGVEGCTNNTRIIYDYSENQTVATPTEIHDAFKKDDNEIKLTLYSNAFFTISSKKKSIHGSLRENKDYNIEFNLKNSTYILKHENNVSYARLRIELSESDVCLIDLDKKEPLEAYEKKCTKEHIEIANDEIKNLSSYLQETNFNKESYVKYLDVLYNEGKKTFIENQKKENVQKEEESKISTNPVAKKLIDNGYTSNSLTSYSKQTKSDDGVDVTLKLNIENHNLVITDGETEIKYNYYTRQGYAGMCVLDFDTGAYDTTSSILSKADCKGVAQSINYLRSFFEKELQEIGITIEDLDSLK